MWHARVRYRTSCRYENLIGREHNENWGGPFCQIVIIFNLRKLISNIKNCFNNVVNIINSDRWMAVTFIWTKLEAIAWHDSVDLKLWTWMRHCKPQILTRMQQLLPRCFNTFLQLTKSATTFEFDPISKSTTPVDQNWLQLRSCCVCGESHVKSIYCIRASPLVSGQ